jgi:hypothetical protein
MASDYAREIGEHLDWLAELVPEKGPGSRRLNQLPPEDRKYVAYKARVADRALVKIRLADLNDRLRGARNEVGK